MKFWCFSRSNNNNKKDIIVTSCGMFLYDVSFFFSTLWFFLLSAVQKSEVLLISLYFGRNTGNRIQRFIETSANMHGKTSNKAKTEFVKFSFA